MLTLALKETVMCKISSKNIFLRRQRVLCYDTRNPFQQRALGSATSAGNIADTEILFIWKYVSQTIFGNSEKTTDL